MCIRCTSGSVRHGAHRLFQSARLLRTGRWTGVFMHVSAFLLISDSMFFDRSNVTDVQVCKACVQLLPCSFVCHIMQSGLTSTATTTAQPSRLGLNMYEALFHEE
jgi:hypothetical protein